MTENILYGELEISSKFSPEAQDLLTQLLNRNPFKRLGTNGAQEIKEHAFFREVDWSVYE